MKRIIVLGMHRSGASALARMIALLGASTGDPAHLRDTGENTALRKVNEALLEGAGGSWDGPPSGDDWLDDATARGLVERGREVLAAEFGDAPVSVWKDARNALTLPFWIELLDEEPAIVLVHRHPAEVAASMKLAYSTRPAHAYALWERYNAAALTASTGLRTIVIDYGQLMSFPAEAATFVSKALGKWGIELPHDPATTDVELSAARRHHIAPDRDRIDAPVATPSQATVFALLDAVAGAHSPLALPQAVPEPSPASQELLAMAASIRRLEAERRELRHNERVAKRAAKRAGGAEGVADPDADETDSGAREAGEAGDRTPGIEASTEPEPQRAEPQRAEPQREREAGPVREEPSDRRSFPALPIAAAPEVAGVDPTPSAPVGAAAGGGGKGKARRARRRSRRAAAAGSATSESESGATGRTDDLSTSDDVETSVAPAATAVREPAEPVGLPDLPTADSAGDTVGTDAAEPTGVPTLPVEPTAVPTLPVEPVAPGADTTGRSEPVGLSTFPTEPATPAPDASSEPDSASSAADGVGPAPGTIAGVSIIDLVLRAKEEADQVAEPAESSTDHARTYGDAGPGMPHLRPYGEPERR